MSRSSRANAITTPRRMKRPKDLDSSAFAVISPSEHRRGMRMCPICQTLRNADRPLAGALVLLVPGLGRPERIGFENSVNLIRTGQDLPHGVGDRHLLDDVTFLNRSSRSIKKRSTLPSGFGTRTS